MWRRTAVLLGFDTNAISELLRPRPSRALTSWVAALPREQQYTSSVVVAELYAGACRSPDPEKWLGRIAEAVLPSVSVLGFDVGCARIYGELHATLARDGTPIGDADTMIAATALRHGLVVVTANRAASMSAHFERVPGLLVRAFEPGQRG